MHKDLARSLRDARDLAPRGQVVVRIHLFGIAYARELQGSDLAALAREAGVPETYATEVHKGHAARRVRDTDATGRVLRGYRSGEVPGR